MINEKEMRPYFVSPLFDSLFVCGGAVWILFAMTLSVSSQTSNSHQMQLLYQISALGAIFFSACHSLATPVLEAVEIFNSKNSSFKSSLCSSCKPGLGSLFALIILAAIILSLDVWLRLPLIAVLCKYYLLLVPYHFLFQIKGIFLIYCRRGGFPLDSTGRRQLDFLFHTTAFYWVAFLLSSGQQAGQTFLFQELPAWALFSESFVDILRLLVSVFAFCYCSRLLFGLGRKVNRVPWIAILLLSSGLAFFLLPIWCVKELWLFVPSFFHGLQYLIVVNERLKENLRESLKDYSSFFYPVSLLLVLFLYGLPWLIFLGSGWKVIAALFVIFQLWHFHLDGHIWKKKKERLQNRSFKNFSALSSLCESARNLRRGYPRAIFSHQAHLDRSTD